MCRHVRDVLVGRQVPERRVSKRPIAQARQHCVGPRIGREDHQVCEGISLALWEGTQSTGREGDEARMWLGPGGQGRASVT
jgi:hypothetical protein